MASKKFSFEGYSISEWFKRNKNWFVQHKNDLKMLAAVIFGLIATTWSDSTAVQALFAAGTGIISKWAIDGIDYFLSA